MRSIFKNIKNLKQKDILKYNILTIIIMIHIIRINRPSVTGTDIHVSCAHVQNPLYASKGIISQLCGRILLKNFA